MLAANKTQSAALVLAVLLTLIFQGCRTVSTGENTERSAAGAVMTEPPFKNGEPEKYQTEVLQTSAIGVEKFFIIRDGAKWRIDSAYGSPDQVSSLHTDKDYVASFAAKSVAEYPATHGFDERENMVTEISFGLINSREKAAYETMGTENGITKYRIAPAPPKNIETVIHYDEKLGLPIKKEIFRNDGANRLIDRTIEFSGFKTEIDTTLFAFPKDFKKVSVEDMKKILTGVKQ
ncbi:MAG: hypothetical protein ABL999_03920 [Pyrinomonadaceae bacterium]